MHLSKRLKRENPNYVGSYAKSEVEKISEVFGMVSAMRSAVEAKGYKNRSVVVTRPRGKTTVDLYIEDEI